MKRLIATSALTLALVAPAFANNLEIELQRFTDNVDMSELTENERELLATTIYGGGTFGEKQLQVDSILRDSDAYAEEQQMFVIPDTEYAKLDTELDRFGYEVAPETLSNTKRLQVMSVIFGGGSFNEKQLQVDSILDS